MRPLAAAFTIVWLGVACIPETSWTDLHSIEELREAFDEGHGRVRLVLIFSPT